MARTPRWTPPTDPFTLADVEPVGVSRAMVRNAERLGRVERLSHGVYIASAARCPEGSATSHVQLARAHQLGSPHLVASHETAALGSGLPTLDPRAAIEGPLQFTTEPGPGRRSVRSAHHVVSLRSLPPEHRTTHPSGLVVTTVPRTAVDLASRADLSGGLMALDAAARRSVAERVGTRRLRDALADPRVRARAVAELRGVAEIAATRLDRPRLERALAFADPRREAASESAAFVLILEAGLPLPDMQVRIETNQGAAWPDFVWSDERLILEVDGKDKYRSDPDALVREKLRQEALERLGFKVIRWMAEDVWRRPQRLLLHLGHTLNARSAV